MLLEPALQFALQVKANSNHLPLALGNEEMNLILSFLFNFLWSLKCYSFCSLTYRTICINALLGKAPHTPTLAGLLSQQ